MKENAVKFVELKKGFNEYTSIAIESENNNYEQIL